jgi:4-amino-4-deoxy-L-arabinose transferase-like glycosyltransferase
MTKTSDGRGFRHFVDHGPALTAIIVLGILIRLAYSFLIFPTVGQDLYWRGVDDGYDELARNLLHGDGYSREAGAVPHLETPPGYTFFLYLLYALTGEETNEGVRIQIVQPLLDGVTCLLIYVLALKVFRRRVVGLLSALGWALYPQIIVYSARVAPEVLFTFLLTCLVVALVRLMETPKAKNAILLGVLWGLAVLVKEKLLFLPPVLLFLVWQGVRLPTRRKALLMFVIAVAMVVPVTPWVVRGFRATGGFVPITLRSGRALRGATTEDFSGADKGLVEFFENRPEREKKNHPSPEQDLQGRARQNAEDEWRLIPEALARIAADPAAYAKGFLVKLAAFWYYGQPKVIVGNMIVQIPLVLLAIAGYIRGWRRYPLLPFMAVIVYFVVIHALTITRMRYSIPVMPEVFLLAVFFMIDLWGRRTRSSP